MARICFRLLVFWGWSFTLCQALDTSKVTGTGIEGLPPYAYITPGDIYLADMEYVHTFDVKRMCTKHYISPEVFQRGIAFATAVKKLNTNDKLLRNITIGIIQMDHCANTALALGETFKALESSKKTLKDSWFPAGWPHVVAGTATLSSTPTATISPAFHLYQRPLVVTSASSDALTVRTVHRYLFRMVPPDSYQVRSHASLWSYIGGFY